MLDTHKDLLKDLDNVVLDTGESDSDVPVSPVAPCVPLQRLGEILVSRHKRKMDHWVRSAWPHEIAQGRLHHRSNA